MNEIDPRESGIDHLLRRSLSAPIPSLPENFDQRVMRKVRRASQPTLLRGRMLLAGYGLVSAATSAYVMLEQGLAWGPVLALILAPLSLAAAVRTK